MMALACFLLVGCSGSVSVKAPAPSPSLTSPCAAPVALPDRALTMTEVEVFWGRDRSALRECGSKVDGLAGR